jgi:transcription initiation factor TFIID TATA-box-binding protein
MNDVMHETPTPRLQNIVATFCTLPIGQRSVDLELLVTQCPFMEFNSKRFAAVVLRILRPKTTCLLFASGKAVCTGARNEIDARTACMKYVNLLCLSGQQFQFLQFKIENIVAAVHCPFRINLKDICEQVSGWVNYEPTLFPGLIFRKVLNGRKKSKKHNTLVFICFQSGKCIITGGHSRAQILSEWITFFDDVLSNNVARFDYGSSGNYRMAQNAFAHNVHDVEMFKNLCYFRCKRRSTLAQTDSELKQLQNNQNNQSIYVECITKRLMQPVELDE